MRIENINAPTFTVNSDFLTVLDNPVLEPVVDDGPCEELGALQEEYEALQERAATTAELLAEGVVVKSGGGAIKRMETLRTQIAQKRKECGNAAQKATEPKPESPVKRSAPNSSTPENLDDTEQKRKPGTFHIHLDDGN